jgi:tetratricopeptide (TPR) repeat protein
MTNTECSLVLERDMPIPMADEPSYVDSRECAEYLSPVPDHVHVLKSDDINVFQCPGATRVIVVFSSRGAGRLEFMGTLKEIPAHLIFLKDPSLKWYQEGIPGIAPCVETLKQFLLEQFDQLGVGAQDSVMLGASMGGYAAMMMGHLLGAHHVVALGPQTFVDAATRAEYRDGRWEDHIGAIRSQVHTSLAELTQGRPNTEYRLLVGKEEYYDWIHALHLYDQCEKPFPLYLVKGCDHVVGAFLNRRDTLRPVLRALLNEPTVNALNACLPELDASIEAFESYSEAVREELLKLPKGMMVNTALNERLPIWKALHTLKPQWQLASFWAGRTLQHQYDFEAALPYFEAAIQAPEGIQANRLTAVVLAVFCYLKLQQYEAGLILATETFAAHPEQRGLANLCVYTVELYLALEQPRQARQFLQERKRFMQGSVSYWIAAFKLHHFNKARGLAQHALKQVKALAPHRNDIPLYEKQMNSLLNLEGGKGTGTTAIAPPRSTKKMSRRQRAMLRK